MYSDESGGVLWAFSLSVVLLFVLSLSRITYYRMSTKHG